MYKPPKGPKPEEMNWIASRIAEYCKNKIAKQGNNYKITTEDIIEIFRNMNDDFDDWWARGLNTREKEQIFLKDLLSRLEKYDIINVIDNTFI